MIVRAKRRQMEKDTQMYMSGSFSGTVVPPSSTVHPGTRADVFIASQGLHILDGMEGFQMQYTLFSKKKKKAKRINCFRYKNYQNKLQKTNTFLMMTFESG